MNETLITFMSDHAAREEERERALVEKQRDDDNKHKANKDRLDKINTRVSFWGLIIAFFTLVVAVVSILVGIEMAHHAELDPAKLFHSLQNDIRAVLDRDRQVGSDHVMYIPVTPRN
jgi:hypothetical protein